MAEISREGTASPEGGMVDSKLGDIINCAVCCGLLHDAKLLPCGHSYCLRCLEDLVDDEDVANTGHLVCPQCLTNIDIPFGGLESLPRNVYIDALVQLKEMGTVDRPGSGDERKASVPVVSVLCRSEKDAKPLSPRSAETWAEGCTPHPAPEQDVTAVVGSDSPRKMGRRKMTQRSPRAEQTKRCDEHSDREMSVFCRDCDQPMCETCFIYRHNGHRYANVYEVAEELRSQLRDNAERMKEAMARHAETLRVLESRRSAIVDNVQTAEQAIGDEVSALTASITADAARLQQQVSVRVQVQLVALDDVIKSVERERTSINELIDKIDTVKLSDDVGHLTRSFHVLHSAATDLLKRQLRHPDALSAGMLDSVVTVSFIPANFRRFLPDCSVNLVGSVMSGNSAENPSAGAPTWSELHQKLEAVEKEKQMLAIEAANATAQMKSTLKQSEDVERHLRWEIRAVELENLRKQHAALNTTLVNTLKSHTFQFTIRGVTMLDGELFVLRVGRKSTDIAVFDSNSFNLQRRLTLPGLSAAQDMTSCARQRCIYVADNGRDAVHRVDRDGDTTIWPLDDKPAGLSVTRHARATSPQSAGNLLITFFVSHQLREYSPDGRLLRRITMDPDIGCPWHAFEVVCPPVPVGEGGRFVVCHGHGLDAVHRVCLVDDEGHVKGAYSGRQSPVNCPVHLAVTDDGFVFVLDSENKRVLLLDPDLSYVRDAVTADNGLNDPRRICWDDINSRLYVADSSGNVLVFEILP